MDRAADRIIPAKEFAHYFLQRLNQKKHRFSLVWVTLAFNLLIIPKLYLSGAAFGGEVDLEDATHAHLTFYFDLPASMLNHLFNHI